MAFSKFMNDLKRKISIPNNSTLTENDYQEFLRQAFSLLSKEPLYFTQDEDINTLELAHLIPDVPESVIVIYLAINDAVCNKGLVCPFLIRHGHNSVFVFDPELYTGGDDVPNGTIDAKNILQGFEPPNDTWPEKWTYVMIENPDIGPHNLWQERGYIDMIPAKLEDFTMLTDFETSRLCIYIDPKAFEHPVNKSRQYLVKARALGEKIADQFEKAETLEDEFEGLVPVVLNKGEKLYVATKDFSPCEHGWTNIHPDNKQWAVVNENSAVPLDLVIAKPPVSEKYSNKLIPPKGSADMTTDWFYRGQRVLRKALLEGMFKG